MTTSQPTNTLPVDLSPSNDALRPLGGRSAGQAQLERGVGITLVVNGQPHTTTARTLQEWVEAQDAVPTALATAVNGTFVPRTARAQHLLHDGDAVLTFQPIQGG